METQFTPFYEIFSHYFGITYKTLEINVEENEQLESFQLNFNSKEKFETQDDLQSEGQGFSNNGRYAYEFIEEKLIGKGSFSEVYKVSHSFDSQNYAIKKIKSEGTVSSSKY